MGGNITKFGFSKKCGQIEDAGQIRIDSSPLHCPICLVVFRKAPEVLPCGHSHCQDCLRKVENYAKRDARDNGTWDSQNRTDISIECSLCRARFPARRQRVKNYAIEAIIESLSTINEAEDPTNEIIAAKNLVVEMLSSNLTKLTAQNRAVPSALDFRRKKC